MEIFTPNRTRKGTDHAASLDSDGTRCLARYLRKFNKALTYKSSEVLPVKAVQRVKLKV